MDIKQLIDSVRDALGDKHGQLIEAADALQRKSDKATNDLKTLKSEADQLRKQNTTLLEKLGVESVDAIDGLPDAKGQAEATKQFQARIKNLEKQLADVAGERDQAVGRVRDASAQAAISAAIAKHGFHDPKVVDRLIRAGLQFDGDAVSYVGDDGKGISIDEAVAGLAKASPYLVKSAGAGGSGYQQQGGRATVNPWAKETFNLTEQIRIGKENPSMAQSLKAAATASASGTGA